MKNLLRLLYIFTPLVSLTFGCMVDSRADAYRINDLESLGLFFYSINDHGRLARFNPRKLGDTADTPVATGEFWQTSGRFFDEPLLIVRMYADGDAAEHATSQTPGAVRNGRFVIIDDSPGKADPKRGMSLYVEAFRRLRILDGGDLSAPKLVRKYARVYFDDDAGTGNFEWCRLDEL